MGKNEFLITSTFDTAFNTVIAMATAGIERAITSSFVLVTGKTSTTGGGRLSRAITNTLDTSIPAVITSLAAEAIVAIALSKARRTRSTLARNWSRRSSGRNSGSLSRAIANTLDTSIPAIIAGLAAEAIVAITLSKARRTRSTLARNWSRRSSGRNSGSLSRAIANTFDTSIPTIITSLAAEAIVAIALSKTRRTGSALARRSRRRWRWRRRGGLSRTIANALDTGIPAVITSLAAETLIAIALSKARRTGSTLAGNWSRRSSRRNSGSLSRTIANTLDTSIPTIITSLAAEAIVAIALSKARRTRSTLARRSRRRWGWRNSGGLSRAIANALDTSIPAVITSLAAETLIAITLSKARRTGSTLARNWSRRSSGRNSGSLSRTIANTLYTGIPTVITSLAAEAFVTVTLALARRAANTFSGSIGCNRSVDACNCSQ
jgi:hypothetical protein